MRLSNAAAAAAALSMIAVPASAAPANPAAKLSLANQDVRAGTQVKNGSRAKGSGMTVALAVGGLALVVIAAVALGHNNKDSKPASS
jgi:hypothetical protein